MHQLVLAIVGSNTCSQIHVQIKYSIAHLQDLIPTLADVLCIPYTWNFSRYVNFMGFVVSRAAVKIYSVKILPPRII